MYRNGLFKVRAQILAYRYNDINTDQAEMDSAEEATAVDAAEILKMAQREYLRKIPPQSEHYTNLSRAVFLKALRSVSKNVL